MSTLKGKLKQQVDEQVQQELPEHMDIAICNIVHRVFNDVSLGCEDNWEMRKEVERIRDMWIPRPEYRILHEKDVDDNYIESVAIYDVENEKIVDWVGSFDEAMEFVKENGKLATGADYE